MKVGIIGSWRSDRNWKIVGERSAFEDFCRKLGVALASQSVQIVVGNDSESTADRFVVEGYCTLASSFDGSKVNDRSCPS